jgi:DNA-binding IclR family transcriptional regulator
MSSRYDGDPRVRVGAYSATVQTAAGRVEVAHRSEGSIERWVAPHNLDGFGSALDTYHADVDDAVDAVFARHGAIARM